MDNSDDSKFGDDIEFFAAQIKSHAKLSYDHVSDFLENGGCDEWQPEADIAKVVNELYEFSKTRADKRKKNAHNRNFFHIDRIKKNRH